MSGVARITNHCCPYCYLLLPTVLTIVTIVAMSRRNHPNVQLCQFRVHACPSFLILTMLCSPILANDPPWYHRVYSLLPSCQLSLTSQLSATLNKIGESISACISLFVLIFLVVDIGLSCYFRKGGILQS